MGSSKHAIHVQKVGELDEEDVIFLALNMAEELSDTLQDILMKLDKLESIDLICVSHFFSNYFISSDPIWVQTNHKLSNFISILLPIILIEK